MADLAGSERVVGVVAHQRGHVERHREARLPVREEERVAAVRFLRGAVAGELPNRPRLPAIHRGIDAARVGELAGIAELLLVTPPLQVLRGVERLERYAGHRRVVLRRQLPAPVAGGPFLVRRLAAKCHQLPPCDARWSSTSSASAYGFSFPFWFSRTRRPTAVSPSRTRLASSRARSATRAMTSCLSRSWRRVASVPLSVR